MAPVRGPGRSAGSTGPPQCYGKSLRVPQASVLQRLTAAHSPDGDVYSLGGVKDQGVGLPSLGILGRLRRNTNSAATGKICSPAQEVSEPHLFYTVCNEIEQTRGRNDNSQATGAANGYVKAVTRE